MFFCIYTDINKTKIKVSIQRVGWGRGRDGCLIQFPCKWITCLLWWRNEATQLSIFKNVPTVSSIHFRFTVHALQNLKPHIVIQQYRHSKNILHSFPYVSKKAWVFFTMTMYYDSICFGLILSLYFNYFFFLLFINIK